MPKSIQKLYTAEAKNYCNCGIYEVFVKLNKKLAALLGLCVLLGVSGCYQVHSDDNELRTVPVTNNPNLVPRSSSQNIPSPKI